MSSDYEIITDITGIIVEMPKIQLYNKNKYEMNDNKIGGRHENIKNIN